MRRLHRHPVLFSILLCLLFASHPLRAQKFEKKKSSYSYDNSSANSAPINPTELYLDSAQYLATIAPMRAIDKINQAIELSIRYKDRGNEAQAYWILGNIQQNLDQHELAIENYNKCINTIFKPVSKSDRAYPGTGNSLTLFRAYKSMALSQLKTNDATAAQKSIDRCFDKQFSAIPDKETSEAQRVKAEILQKLNRNEEALQMLNLTLKQETERGDLTGRINSLIALSDYYRNQRNDSKALEMLAQAKTLAELSKSESAQLRVNNLMAQIYRAQNKTSNEVSLRNSNIALANTTLDKKQAIEETKDLGDAYFKSGETRQAIPYYEKIFFNPKLQKVIIPQELFDKSNDLESIAGTYKALAEEFLKSGDSQKALMYLNTFVTIQDSIRSIRKRELDQALQLSNQIGKNQQRIELLEKERALSDRSIEILKQDRELKENELRNRNLVIGSLCFLLLFMGGGVYYIWRSSREKRRANQLLAIKSLRGQMNPHFIFNALNSVNHYISQNDERAANKYLSDFSKLMRSVMETSKHDLITLAEEVDILKLYLQLEHSRFKQNFDYEFVVDPALDTSEFELPPMLIQPFIENAIWHGLRYIESKGFLSLRMTQHDNGGLLVTVSDNGIGRQKSLEIKTKNQKLQHSTGMQNIENRIRIMNELFNTKIKTQVNDASPGHKNPGTEVKLIIPKTTHPHA